MFGRLDDITIGDRSDAADPRALPAERMALGADADAMRRRLRGRPVPYRTARDLGLIDPIVEPLVAALNETGRFRTVASCSGHGILPRPEPYVSFRCRIEAARSIARMVSLTAGRADGLRLHWQVEAMFDPGLELVFVLRCPERNFPMTSMFTWRRTLAADVAILASSVRENVGLERFKGQEPEIDGATDDPDDQCEYKRHDEIELLLASGDTKRVR